MEGLAILTFRQNGLGCYFIIFFNDSDSEFSYGFGHLYI
jgi:hypothetical protein